MVLATRRVFRSDDCPVPTPPPVLVALEDTSEAPEGEYESPEDRYERLMGEAVRINERQTRLAPEWEHIHFLLEVIGMKDSRIKELEKR